MFPSIIILITTKSLEFFIKRQYHFELSKNHLKWAQYFWTTLAIYLSFIFKKKILSYVYRKYFENYIITILQIHKIFTFNPETDSKAIIPVKLCSYNLYIRIDLLVSSETISHKKLLLILTYVKTTELFSTWHREPQLRKLTVLKIPFF